MKKGNGMKPIKRKTHRCLKKINSGTDVKLKEIERAKKMSYILDVSKWKGKLALKGEAKD